MPKLSKFATMLAEFSTQGWVHSVKFSPSGDKLAWVAHDASINIVHMDNHNTVGTSVQNIRLLYEVEQPLRYSEYWWRSHLTR